MYPDAKREFKKAIEVDAAWPDAHYGLALTCIKLKQY